jgi:hypothetical protein
MKIRAFPSTVKGDDAGCGPRQPSPADGILDRTHDALHTLGRRLAACLAIQQNGVVSPDGCEPRHRHVRPERGGRGHAGAHDGTELSRSSSATTPAEERRCCLRAATTSITRFMTSPAPRAGCPRTRSRPPPHRSARCYPWPGSTRSELLASGLRTIRDGAPIPRTVAPGPLRTTPTVGPASTPRLTRP